MGQKSRLFQFPDVKLATESEMDRWPERTLYAVYKPLEQRFARLHHLVYLATEAFHLCERRFRLPYSYTRITEARDLLKLGTHSCDLLAQELERVAHCVAQ